MSDDEINAAIALHLGWKGVVSYPDIGVMGFPPARNECDPVHLKSVMWTVDLNAMHEAEKVLCVEQIAMYFWRLCDASKKDNPFMATARQRAEAFLRALGKWKGQP